MTTLRTLAAMLAAAATLAGCGAQQASRPSTEPSGQAQAPPAAATETLAKPTLTHAVPAEIRPNGTSQITVTLDKKATKDQVFRFYYLNSDPLRNAPYESQKVPAGATSFTVSMTAHAAPVTKRTPVPFVVRNAEGEGECCGVITIVPADDSSLGASPQQPQQAVPDVRLTAQQQRELFCSTLKGLVPFTDDVTCICPTPQSSPIRSTPPAESLPPTGEQVFNIAVDFRYEEFAECKERTFLVLYSSRTPLLNPPTQVNPRISPRFFQFPVQIHVKPNMPNQTVGFIVIAPCGLGTATGEIRVLAGAAQPVQTAPADPCPPIDAEKPKKP